MVGAAVLGLALVSASIAGEVGACIAGSPIVAMPETPPTAVATPVQVRSVSSLAIRPVLDLPPEAEMRRFAAIVERASRAHGVDEALVRAVIVAESSYDPDAISSAGASGLMQLMPETAKRYGVHDLFDPVQNVSGGVRCLRDLLTLFDGNVELALAAYNSGANAVIRAGNRVPPRPETIAFVPKVIDYYRHFQSRKG